MTENRDSPPIAPVTDITDVAAQAVVMTCSQPVAIAAILAVLLTCGAWIAIWYAMPYLESDDDDDHDDYDG